MGRIFFTFILFFLVCCVSAYEIKKANYKIIVNENPWKLTINSSEDKLILEESLLEGKSQEPLSYYDNGWQYVSNVIRIEHNGNTYKFVCKTSDGRDARVVINAMEKMIELSFFPPEDTAYVKEVLTSGAKYNSHFYGFGQRFNALDQRGSTIEMWNIDQPKTFGTSSYINVPFFFEIVNEGGVLPGSVVESGEVLYHTYGFYLKNTSKSTFRMCSDMRRSYSVTVNDNKMNYVIFVGDSPKDILKSYIALTGKPEIPPKWVFAPWKSRDNYYSVADVFEDVDMMRELHIPMSVLVLDSPWETAYNDFTFNEIQFPAYEKMIEYIHNKGNKLLLWITPFTNKISVVEIPGQKPSASNFEYADKNGYFVKDNTGSTMLIDWWKGTGGAIDFTDKEATNWWQENITKLVNMGVDGFKTDDGEYIPYNAVFSNGLTGQYMHNIYALLFNKATYEVLKKIKGEAILFARSGWAGSQVYPAVWAGDQESSFNYRDGLPAVIVAGLSSALSGFTFWSHDIGGYRTKADKEVFIRWAQFGCFTPLMQIHGQNREPWKFDNETVDIYRKYAKLHTSLFPYIYTYANIAAKGGLPIMRPLILEFPEDEKVYNEDFEYLFGDYFLVAPIYQRGTQRQVYLPKGTWYDYWDSTVYEGPKYIVYNATMDKIPLFVKKGAVIPKISDRVDSLVERNNLMDKSVITLNDVLDEIFLEIYPINSGTFTIYDGTTVEMSKSKDSLELLISKMPKEKKCTIDVYSETTPTKVLVNNKTLKKYNRINKVLANNTDLYYYDKTKNMLHIITIINRDSKIIVTY